jgi:hypothetical protein
MGNTDISGKQFHFCFCKNSPGKTHALLFMHPVIIGHDTCGILSSVL